MTVGDDKNAGFRVGICATFKLKHLHRDICSVLDLTDIDCYQTSEIFVHKALIRPNSSGAGLYGISPQVLKDLTINSNGQSGLTFLRASTNDVNMIIAGKYVSNFVRTSLVRNYLR